MGIDDPEFGDEAPLWVYLLAESGVDYNGAHLGPVGSLLVSEVFGGMLQLDKDGIRKTGWTPDGGTFTLGDFLCVAGVVPECKRTENAPAFDGGALLRMAKGTAFARENRV